MGESAAAEAHLSDAKALVLLADRVLDGDANIVELHFGVAALALGDAMAAEVGDVPHDLDAVGVSRNEDDRGALVGMGVQIGPGHHEVEVGVQPVGGPPLVGVDDPLVAVLDGRALEHLRVRSAALFGLGHRERRGELALHERAEVLLFLFFRADHLEGVHVPLLGRVRPNRERADQRATDLLEGGEHVAEVQPLPAVLLGDLRREEVALSGLLPQVLDLGHRDLLAGSECLAFARDDDLVHEVRYATRNRRRRL